MSRPSREEIFDDLRYDEVEAQKSIAHSLNSIAKSLEKLANPVHYVGAFDGVQGLICGAVSKDGIFECDFNLEHSGTHTWEREGIALKRVGP